MLQIRIADRAAQIVRLRSQRCTIGSDSTCTLRLRGSDIQPVHCVVLRGIGGASVRCWASDTRLNGQAFTDAPLKPGDRLTMGRAEITVLQTGVMPAACAPELPMPPEPRRPDEPARRASPTPPGEDLDARKVELETLQRRLAVERVALEEQQEAWSQRQSELEAREADLAARCRQLDARQVEIEAAQERLAVERAALEEREKAWSQRQSELEAREADLAARCRQLDARQKELDARQRDLRAKQDELENRQTVTIDSPQQSESVAPSAGAPVQTLDVLRRLGFRVPTDEEPENAIPATSGRVAELARDASDAVSASDAADHAGHEEESIDRYMARLMERLHGENNRARVASPSSEAGPERLGWVGGGESAPRDPFEPSSTTSSPVTAPGEPVELAPRALAPEKTVDLFAMRELANISAKVAIERHARGRLARASARKVLVAAVASACGGALVWMGTVRGAGNLAFNAGIVGFIIALLWFVQYAVLAGRMMWKRPGRWERGANLALQERRRDGSPGTKPPAISQFADPSLTPVEAGPAIDDS